ncbi:hypothetical protein WSM22_19730 [Cytophagales bacterium WSM2-2]|nr:hypothetical protein WSM22_19730 [Cytophagales bacterium WSM2-2]
MKKKIFLKITAVVVLFASCGEETVEIKKDPCSNIEPDVNFSLIQNTVEILAADTMYGRWIKQNGITKTQNYLASKLNELNLQPLNGSFLSPFELLKSVPTNITVNLNGHQVTKDRIALNPLAKSGAFTSSQLYQIKSIDPQRSFHEQYQQLLENLWNNVVRDKNILVLVPEVHAGEFKLLRTYLEDKSIFKDVSYRAGEWDTFYGGDNILFVLSNETQVQTFDASYNIDEFTLNNVAGILPGKSKPDEIVIFSAHFDHLGIVSPVGKDSIANGANDNASGVAGVLALADYYAKARENERTIWFVLFDAEESGLIGSKDFVSKCQGSNIKYVINMDMIGNTMTESQGAAYLTGFVKSTMGSEMQMNIDCPELNILSDADFGTGNSLYSRSDNYSFDLAGIKAHTVTTFNNRNYAYYHNPDDEVDKIDFDAIAKVVKSVILGSKTFVNGQAH